MAEADFDAAFEALKTVFTPVMTKLAVDRDSATEFGVCTRKASPFKQHKGHAMFFGAVKKGKAYVSLHLFPLYMNGVLVESIKPELKKRMQGKTCFNFKTAPDAAQLRELRRLAKDGLKGFQKMGWA